MKLSSLILPISFIGLSAAEGEKIPNQYIITFKDDSPLNAVSTILGITNSIPLLNIGNRILYQYTSLFKGVSARLDEATANMIKNLPFVDQVEQDQMFKAWETQDDALWGLARISQREKLDKAPYQYKYDENAGEGVNVYVLDTGVNIDHVDFDGRATWGNNMAKNSSDSDQFGHGTHCAGTIGGKTYGVAKRANIVAVKVLGDDGSGSTSQIVAGIDWVAANANGAKGNVISMSLGGFASLTTVMAVERAVKKGIVTVVAAGNSYLDACLYSPANAPNAITVGATDVNDVKADFSNFGPCVNIFAPGVKILSTWIGNNTATNTISGTSMATPHVAGLAATLLSQGVPAKDVKKKLVELGTRDAISGLLPLTPNVLAFNGYSS